jgi:quercetin dioxygenase-like cupin family protein
MQTEATQMAHVPAGSREIWWIDSRVDVKLTAAESGGQLGMWLWLAQRGAASPLHVHEREDEQFVVIDGAARFQIGDQTLNAGAGDLVFLPRRIPHSYLITSETARLIGSATPGGFESYFTELAEPVLPGQSTGPGPTVPAMMAAAPRYGIEILGPPPALD